MSQKEIVLGDSIRVTVPDGWADMTDELSQGPEFTLARPAVGCGALQISIASFECRFLKAFLSDLLDMASSGLLVVGPTFDQVMVESP
jgi:hypothetical protein